MANLVRNPNQAVRPDFAAIEHAPQRLMLTNGGLSEEQAIQMLTNLWDSTNERDIAEWNTRQAEEAQAQQEAEWIAQEEAERALQEEEELRAAALAEEKKKYKSKFAPIVDAPVPIGPVLIPSKVALTRMKKGEYVELWYFTNKGIRAAEKSATRSSRNKNAFVFVHDEDDDTPSLVPASSVGDSFTSSLTEDKDLSWEEFRQATPRMIQAMVQEKWPQDRIDMFIEFWTALENHPWRHSDDFYSRQALLVYQGEQRKRWHIAVDTTFSWSLAKICTTTLTETRQELVHRVQVRETDRLQRVRDFLPSLS